MSDNILGWELQDDIRRAYKLAIEDHRLYSTCFERIHYLNKFLDKSNWFDISFNERNGVKRVTLWMCQDSEHINRDRLQLATISTDANEGMICNLFEYLIYKNLRKLKRNETTKKERETNKPNLLFVHTFDSPFPKVLNLGSQQPERFGRLIFDESQSADSRNEQKSNEHGDSEAAGRVQ